MPKRVTSGKLEGMETTRDKGRSEEMDGLREKRHPGCDAGGYRGAAVKSGKSCDIVIQEERMFYGRTAEVKRERARQKTVGRKARDGGSG